MSSSKQDDNRIQKLFSSWASDEEESASGSDLLQSSFSFLSSGLSRISSSVTAISLDNVVNSLSSIPDKLIHYVDTGISSLHTYLLADDIETSFIEYLNQSPLLLLENPSILLPNQFQQYATENESFSIPFSVRHAILSDYPVIIEIQRKISAELFWTRFSFFFWVWSSTPNLLSASSYPEQKHEDLQIYDDWSNFSSLDPFDKENDDDDVTGEDKTISPTIYPENGSVASDHHVNNKHVPQLDKDSEDEQTKTCGFSFTDKQPFIDNVSPEIIASFECLGLENLEENTLLDTNYEHGPNANINIIQNQDNESETDSSNSCNGSSGSCCGDSSDSHSNFHDCKEFTDDDSDRDLL